MSRRVAVIVGPTAPVPLVDALEGAGLEVQHRDHTKQRQATAPLPTGCVIVIALKADSFGQRLRDLARGAGVPYVHSATASTVTRDLIEMGILQPTPENVKQAAPIHLLMVGNLARAERFGLEAIFTASTRVGVAVCGWVAPGLALPEKAFECSGIGVVSDKTPSDLKEIIAEWAESAVWNGTFAKTPPRIPRVSAPLASWKDGTALLKLIRLVQAARESGNAPDSPTATKRPRPNWAMRHEERAKEKEAARAAAEAEFEREHDEALHENFEHDLDRKHHEEAMKREEAYAMNERSAQTITVVPPPAPEAVPDPEPPTPKGTWIGGTELITLADAAGAIFTTAATLRKLADDGKIATVAINGEPYISYSELEKAEAAMAPLMDDASDLAVRPRRTDGLLYTDEAAAYLGCSDGTITRKTNEGFITRAGKEGKSWLYRKADLDDWRERRKSQATMRRRVGPLGIENGGRDILPAEAASPADRAAIKARAVDIQALLASAGYQSVTVTAESITVRKVVVEEEEL